MGKQCHKLSISEWFTPPICGNLGGGLWHCFTHIIYYYLGIANSWPCCTYTRNSGPGGHGTCSFTHQHHHHHQEKGPWLIILPYSSSSVKHMLPFSIGILILNLNGMIKHDQTYVLVGNVYPTSSSRGINISTGPCWIRLVSLVRKILEVPKHVIYPWIVVIYMDYTDDICSFTLMFFSSFQMFL